MEEIEKVLKYLEEKKPGDGGTNSLPDSDRQKSILKIVNLLKKSLPENSRTSFCGHEPEDICAYFEDNLSEPEKNIIEEQIFGCDNCFNIYSDLQAISSSLKDSGNTPEWLKETVLEKFDKNEQKELSKGWIYNLKKNLFIQASGIAVAAIALFFIISPFNKNEKVLVANAPRQESAVSDQMKEMKINDEFASKAKKSAGKPKDEKTTMLADKPEFNDTSEREKNNNYQSSANKIPAQPVKPKRDPFLATDIIKAKPEVSIQKQAKQTPVNHSSPQIDINPGTLPLSVKTPENQPVLIARLPETEMKQIPKEEEQMMSNGATSETGNAKRNSEADAKTSETKKEEISGTLQKSAETPEMKANNALSLPPLVKRDDNAATVLKKSEGKKATAVFSKDRDEIKSEITINNVSIEKTGFIVLYENSSDKPGNQIGVSNLLTPGTNKNIVIKFNSDKSVKNIIVIFYEDKDNNNIFDKTDLAGNSKIIRQIEINGEANEGN